MELVEIFEDGSEESLTSFMDVEVARKPVMRTSDGGGGDGPSESERPMPLVPVRRLPTTRYLEMKCPLPKLMLWVDGMLAPALNRPLFINLSGAIDLGVSRPRPTPTPWPVQSEGGKRRSLSESGGAYDAGMGSEDDNDDGPGDEFMMVGSSGRGAASHVDLDEVATHRWHGQRRPSSAPSLAPTTAGGFSSPSAGSPPSSSTAALSTGDVGAESGAESGAQPPAPPPSPVVGRSVPRDVFGGAFKRKLRDEHSASSAINSMMRSMENDLLAMHLEARPAKFMRCTSGFA